MLDFVEIVRYGDLADESSLRVSYGALLILEGNQVASFITVADRD